MPKSGAMVDIVLINPPDQFGRSVEVSWHPPAGPLIRLTTEQWHDLLAEIERLGIRHVGRRREWPDARR